MVPKIQKLSNGLKWYEFEVITMKKNSIAMKIKMGRLNESTTPSANGNK